MMSSSTDLHPFANPGRTKLSLVSRGVALPDGLQHASQWVSQANAIETVLDIKLPTGQLCTVPVGQPYTQQSSFSLEQKGDKTLLHCGGEVSEVTLIPAPVFYQKKTRSGARMGSFASLHDRLLILHPFMGCGFFNQSGNACQYCQYESMTNEDQPPLRDPLELVEAVRAALAEREVETVYLYNGYSPSDDVGLRQLVAVIALLRKHLGHRQIALETIAPLDVQVIDELYEAGLDVFVCNLEINDAERFAQVCPGKHASGGQDAIYGALQYARSVFRAGAVVSHLIVGLEPLQSTLDGMKKLIEQGIVPMLLPFRPLPGTPLCDNSLPSLDDVEHALLVQYELLEHSGLPTHRLRDMGRVLTPMESGLLIGKDPYLSEQVITSSMGSHVSGWMDALRRYLRSNGKVDENYQQTLNKPMHLLLAKEGIPYFALIILSALGLWAGAQDIPAGLTDSGWNALLIFLFCLALWVSGLIPLAATSLLGLALLPLTGVLDAAEAYSMFGSSALFFILGAFMLAAGARVTGLSEHMALALIDRVGSGPKQLLMAMLFLPAVMAFFMPEHAVAAVFLPIAWEIVRSLDLKIGDRYAQSLFFAVAWGAIIGGVMTLLGGARGPLALGMVQEISGQSFSFMDWTMAAAPVVILMLLLAAVILLVITPFEGVNVDRARQCVERRQLEVGNLEPRGWLMGGLLLVTVIAWMFAGHALSLASIALLSVAAMFALRLVRWDEIEQHVSWSVVLMYGGAIAVGSALSVSGAGAWVAMQFFPAGLVGLSLMIVLTIATLLLTEGVSNAAAVAILLPIAIPVGLSAGIDPLTVALTVGIVAGFAFMLPMGTPPNAMIYATGFVQRLAMLRFGGMLSLAALILFVVVSSLWWPMVGVGLSGS
ncbi:DASS family sodium-coupled anion symporter [Mariprofundus sp. EBB-1]|uniref:DASS family sodium-coupled anion symporter n=1 Tax=Mariprofundus sp. EBB-1 TaxID=2650971 RepID=UPI001F38AA3E|nr:DASS family sodium-coupled anion symporter [Mariprofundus sp. EBB-1]